MPKNQKAFTLVELLVTVAVVGIVLSFAVPSFNKQILNSRSVAQGEEFIGALNLARYEAVRRARRVSLCASSDSTTCTGDWKDGFILFVDEAAADNAAPALGSTPIIIKTYGKSDSRSVIDVENSSTAITFIRYTALGSLARVSNNNPIIIESSIQGCSGRKAITITIGLSGMISTLKHDC